MKNLFPALITCAGLCCSVIGLAHNIWWLAWIAVPITLYAVTLAAANLGRTVK